MNQVLRDALVQSLENQEELLLVPVTQFFEGNDDLGSIGCNLIEHPGIEKFRDILLAIANRGDIEAVFAQISEVDCGPQYWPFTDMIWFVGVIPVEELQQLLAPLEPDVVGPASSFFTNRKLPSQYGSRLLGAWWD